MVGMMSTVDQPNPPTPATQVILVPGFWLGAWAWDEVVPHLRGHGLEPVALTLPGLEPDHPDRGSVTLADQVAAIEAALAAAPEGAPVVLVAHSGAAVPASVVIDRHVDTIAHAVFVDTVPVIDGYVMAQDIEGAEHPLAAQWDEEFEQGSMAGLSEEHLATFQQRAVPQPTGPMRERVALVDARRLDVPMTVVCTAYSGTEYRDYAKQGMSFLAGMLEYRAIRTVDLPTGHWPMWSRPADLAAEIAAAAGATGGTSGALVP